MVKFAKWLIKGYGHIVPMWWMMMNEIFVNHAICKVIYEIIFSIAMIIGMPFNIISLIALYYADPELAELMWAEETE